MKQITFYGAGWERLVTFSGSNAVDGGPCVVRVDRPDGRELWRGSVDEIERIGVVGFVGAMENGEPSEPAEFPEKDAGGRLDTGPEAPG